MSSFWPWQSNKRAYEPIIGYGDDNNDHDDKPRMNNRRLWRMPSPRALTMLVIMLVLVPALLMSTTVMDRTFKSDGSNDAVVVVVEDENLTTIETDKTKVGGEVPQVPEKAAEDDSANDVETVVVPETKPAEEEEEVKPAEEEAKPAEEEAKPAEEEAKPAEEETKPAEEETKPAEEAGPDSEPESKDKAEGNGDNQDQSLDPENQSQPTEEESVKPIDDPADNDGDEADKGPFQTKPDDSKEFEEEENGQNETETENEHKEPQELKQDNLPRVPNPPVGDHRLVILLPADASSPDLCKVIISAMSLGYPTPIVINFGEQLRDNGFGKTHLAKITGTLEYLDHMLRGSAHDGDRLHDNDLVVVVDAYDVWFQLTPDVLIKRYHEANRQANERLAKLWPNAETMPMEQKIIISAQKKCFPAPSSGSHLHCDTLPDSPLREDLYGNKTDHPDKDTFHDIRPKYVNSGSIMGPAKDMQRYFRRVQNVMERSAADGHKMYSDQGVFGEVFGEQEVHRELLRELHNKGVDLPKHEGTDLLAYNTEYHVGLDYTQQLFIATVFEEDDGKMLELSDQAFIDEESKKLNIDPVRLHGVPQDITDSPNPLKAVVSDEEKPFVNWANMTLYADFFTTAIPVALHHNAHVGGRKARRSTWWDKPWYFPHLRELIDIHLRKRSLDKLVSMPAGEKLDGTATYWPLKSDETKRKVRQFTKEQATKGLLEMDFGTVCKYKDETPDSDSHWYDEVFRDGKGPIKMPRMDAKKN